MEKTACRCKIARFDSDGQPVALVVADSLENASEAARRLQVDYERAPFETDFRQRTRSRRTAQHLARAGRCPILGNVPAALASASAKVEQLYETADRHHNGRWSRRRRSLIGKAAGFWFMMPPKASAGCVRRLPRRSGLKRRLFRSKPNMSGVASAARGMSGRACCSPLWRRGFCNGR